MVEMEMNKHRPQLQSGRCLNVLMFFQTLAVDLRMGVVDEYVHAPLSFHDQAKVFFGYLIFKYFGLTKDCVT